MRIQRQFFPNHGSRVPAAVIEPRDPIGAVVLAHGFGGCKEEQAGLAWRIAEAGFVAISIDLRGHGEHPLPMDHDIPSDLEAAISYARQFGKVVALGHSMGGRLALLSSADFTLAISPAFEQVYGETTHKAVNGKRSYRVREAIHDANFEVLRKLPLWQPNPAKPAAFIFGTRDIPEIAKACRKLKADGHSSLEVTDALHGDIFLMETTIRAVIAQLKTWLGVTSLEDDGAGSMQQDAVFDMAAQATR